MKRIFALCLAFVLLLGCLVGCAKPVQEDVTIHIAGMNGPTSLGLVKLLSDNEAGTTKNKYEFSRYDGAGEITPKLITGELDMAALPANVAATLCQKSNGAIKVVAINTLGVLYVVEKGNSIHSLQDLKGKTIYATGKGTTPEYALRYVLEKNGIDPDTDLTIEWKSAATEIGTLLGMQDNAIALLPQPYVTSVQSTGAHIALDLTDEWNKVGNGSELLTGVMVVRTAFADQHPQAVADFLSEYETSTAFINKGENLDDAAALVEKYVGLKTAAMKKAIPYCHITYIAGEQMKTLLGKYLEVLYAQDPSSVGGKLPEDSFYYLAK